MPTKTVKRRSLPMDIVNWPTDQVPTMAMASRMALARMVIAIYAIDKRLLNKYNLSTKMNLHKYLICRKIFFFSFEAIVQSKIKTTTLL